MTSSQYSRITDELLSAYIDNAVSEQERSLVEAAVSADAEVAWRLDTLQQTVQMLRTLPELALPRAFTLHESQLVEGSRSGADALGKSEPASWLGRVAAGWRGFWGPGSAVFRNLAAASLVLLLVLVGGNTLVNTLSSDLVAPAVVSFTEIAPAEPQSAGAPFVIEGEAAAEIPAEEMPAEAMLAEELPAEEMQADELPATQPEATLAEALPEVPAAQESAIVAGEQEPQALAATASDPGAASAAPDAQALAEGPPVVESFSAQALAPEELAPAAEDAEAVPPPLPSTRQAAEAPASEEPGAAEFAAAAPPAPAEEMASVVTSEESLPDDFAAAVSETPEEESAVLASGDQAAPEVSVLSEDSVQDEAEDVSVATAAAEASPAAEEAGDAALARITAERQEAPEPAEGATAEKVAAVSPTPTAQPLPAAESPVATPYPLPDQPSLFVTGGFSPVQILALGLLAATILFGGLWWRSRGGR